MIAPRKPKKPHPAEIAAEEQMISAIRFADHFLASLFVGRGEYRKRTGGTVLAAMQHARALERSASSTRRCMIYAIGKDGRATFITEALIERLRRAR